MRILREEILFCIIFLELQSGKDALLLYDDTVTSMNDNQWSSLR